MCGGVSKSKLRWGVNIFSVLIPLIYSVFITHIYSVFNINDIPNKFILLTFNTEMIQQKQNKDIFKLI